MAGPAAAVAVPAANDASAEAATSYAPARWVEVGWPRAAFGSALHWADLVLLFAISMGLAAALAPGGLFAAPLGFAAPFLCGPILAIPALRLCGAYRFRPHENAGEHAARVATGALSAALGAAMLALVIGAPADAVLTAGVLGAATLVLAHEGWRRLAQHLSRTGRFAHNVVVVGATHNAERLIETNARTGEVNVMAVFDDRAGRVPHAIGGAPVLGGLDDLFAWPDLPRADCIIITVTSQAAERTRALIERLRPLPNKIVLFLDQDGFRPETTTLARVADLPVVYVSGQPQDGARLILKRIEDVAAAILALAAFAVPMVLVALAIRLDSPGPVLFRQKRHGFNNRIIEVFKFRSMRADMCGGPTLQVTEDDPRVTRVGGFIRKTSLDELPQLFNVLRGEMSMVGPRPHAIDMKTGEVESARLVADYAHRCRMKPGITGWAQIHGSRGPVHTAEEVETRVRYDVDYIQRWSLLLDVWILLRTIPCFLGDSLRTR